MKRYSVNSRQNPAELRNDFWINHAQSVLRSKLETRIPINNRPKNIIFFIGDGMSIPTVSASRLHIGGDENFNTIYDQFPYFGLARTYCVNRQVPDSASTATAYLTGVKTNYAVAGVDANVARYSCEGHGNPEFHTTSIADWAMDAGKAAGFVTTAAVTHASPAPLYAHSGNRHWETDVDMSEHCDPSLYEDIAEQLVYGKTGRRLKVVLGGGREKFLMNTTRDEEGNWGMREDGKDLIEAWKEEHKDLGKSEYVWNRDQLMKVDLSETDYLLGLFEANYMKYDYLRQEDPLEPSITDMTEMAIKMLRKEENGYFLFVEGAQIDNAHHGNRVKRALDETRALGEAIELARRMTDAHDTLIVVSADHGHVMTYTGFADRNNDIFGIAGTSDRDNLPYTTMSYANGPGNDNLYGPVFGERADVSTHNLGTFTHRYYSNFRLSSETHSGDDVGVYAMGPMSHLFTGAYEQNSLPYMMAYAAEIGPYYNEPSSGVIVKFTGSMLLLVVIVQVFLN